MKCPFQWRDDYTTHFCRMPFQHLKDHKCNCGEEKENVKNVDNPS